MRLTLLMDNYKMENIFTGIGSDKPIGTINGEIGKDFNPASFAATLRELSSKGIKPQVNINTPGGGVFGGMDMLDVIHTEGLNTHAVGLAASFGGMTLMYGKFRTMNDFAIIMLHSARGSKNKDLLEKVNNSFRSILENTTEIPSRILDDIFIRNKDVYFDADDAEKYKMVDRVIPTNVRIKDKIAALMVSEVYN